MTKSLYWHDYETFGLDPQRDRAAQFAGLRTDIDLNIIADPCVIYCKPTHDYLPSPESCLITGITPQQALEEGVCEAEFITKIHQQLVQAHNTCVVGYNNLRFDDEVTRNLLYRNFFDPYAREWKNGNSRWDIIDLARTTRTLRPDGISWPNHDDGNPSFKLEQIAQQNNIKHENAHCALDDVYATLEVARLIKHTQPKLYQFLFNHRGKHKALDLLQISSFEPVVHVSGKYCADKGNLAVVVPICRHPTNNNGVLVYDLSVNPKPMLTLEVAQIQQRIFTKKDDLPDNVERIPLKTVHINKCPVLAPISVLRKQDLERLQLDLKLCRAHLKVIAKAKYLQNKVASVFASPHYENSDDPDLMLYSGGFFNDSDRTKMDYIRTLRGDELTHYADNFCDPRLVEMLFRYRGRNYPTTLNQCEQQRWLHYRHQRFNQLDKNGKSMQDNFYQQLEALKQDATLDQQIIADLVAYADQIISKSK